ncbi:coiled-coil domain-containing protein [Gorillibacterium sp. sgz5001074]|uniref:coiled-coil domain-containing protein n=1 Tax=Gorillibacterium sp. sgz5001074 TaxID=3446695 RepID=UPI003F66BDBD
MGKPLRYTILIILCAAILLSQSSPGSADTTLDEIKQLLQKGLTLSELDQEIARLSGREIQVGEQIGRTEELIAANQADVTKTREHAAKVLRAYYMGDRDKLWMLLFSAKSLSDALSIYEYLNMIVHNDHHSLNAYTDSYQALTDSKSKLENERQELQAVKARFIEQREKALAVQKEIDEALAASANAAALKTELDKFTQEWKEKGVPLFRSYLTSISSAMQSLPELMTAENLDINIAKRTLTFTITDVKLTEFFRTKDPIFHNITFGFEDDSFKAFGTDNGTQVSIIGKYTVESEPNRLQFHVERLTYNGFVLPDTSNRALEQEFDLGFMPSKYIKGVEATDMTMKGGKLSLKLKQN